MCFVACLTKCLVSSSLGKNEKEKFLRKRGRRSMNTVLQATKRKAGSRSNLSGIRKSGDIPANVYGYRTEATPITVDTKSFMKVIQQHGQNAIFKLNLEGQTVNVVISEIQRCALKGNIKHIDFQAINMSEELEVEVPIVVIGESIGAKEGGVLNLPNRELKIKVKPSQIPESIEIDVSSLNVGDTIALGDIRHTIGFEVLHEDDFTLATVTPPASEPASSIDPPVQDPIAIETPEAQA